MFLIKLIVLIVVIWIIDKVNNVNFVFNVIFVDVNNNVLYNIVVLNIFLVDFSKVVKVYIVLIVDDWIKYEDNKIYNGILIIKNVLGYVLVIMKVFMIKVLFIIIFVGFFVKIV